MAHDRGANDTRGHIQENEFLRAGRRSVRTEMLLQFPLMLGFLSFA